MSHVTKLAVALVMLGAAAPALAAAGNGIRFGGSEGRVHPFVELQLGWDSNVYASTPTTSVSDTVRFGPPRYMRQPKQARLNSKGMALVS